jgi:ATP-dependent DNA helicase PIF1
MKRKLEVGPELSPSQTKALALVLAGKNVFITGAAGTGKSFLIEEMMKQLREAGRKPLLTSSTGISAYNVGGITLHSFAGIGIGEGEFTALFKKLLYGKKERVKCWQETDVLIIDEVSMVATAYLKRVERVARLIRKAPNSVFGGIQVVALGDFFQCPSIVKEGDKEKYGDDEAALQLFETQLWRNQLHMQTVALRENFRQAGEAAFIDVLSRVRVAETTKEDEAVFQGRLLSQHAGVERGELIKLCSRRADAEAINKKALEGLTTEAHHFKGVLTQYGSDGKPLPMKDGLLEWRSSKTPRFPVEEELELKVGAQVLLCFNMNVSGGLANGSRGVVIDFQRGEVPRDPVLYPLVEFEKGAGRHLIQTYCWEQIEHGRPVSGFRQIPLILRYAVTIHKAQGLTLERGLVTMDFFECGQGYVALSRFRRLEDLYFTNVDVGKLRVSQPALKFYRENGLL